MLYNFPGDDFIFILKIINVNSGANFSNINTFIHDCTKFNPVFFRVKKC